METCVVVSQHPRNHHHHQNGRTGRSGFPGSGLYFSSPPPSRAFRGINCRSAFQSGAGILPPPLSAFPPSTTSSSSSPASLSPRSRSDLSSPRSRGDLPSPRSEPPPRRQQPSRRSSPIPISTKRTTSLPSPSSVAADGGSLLAEDSIDISSSGSRTELWAGPAYSNSPPPSSLPIPKFSLRGKRSASLDLPQPLEREDMRPLPKSAPASPSREDITCSPTDRFFSDAFATTATWDLCRMLNLNLDEE